MIFLPVLCMRQSTLLISRFLLEKYPELKKLKGKKLTVFLHRLLRDPFLRDKMRELKSVKYTKQYQQDGLDLQPLYFYPFPEDWCHLSALSNGSGFSRCLIFIHLLEYYIGEKTLKKNVTTSKNSEFIDDILIYCKVRVHKIRRTLARTIYWQKNQTCRHRFQSIPLPEKPKRTA